jgi:hypothetical protein
MDHAVPELGACPFGNIFEASEAPKNQTPPIRVGMLYYRVSASPTQCGSPRALSQGLGTPVDLMV